MQLNDLLQDETNYFKTETHHVLIRGPYSARPLYFIKNPSCKGSQYIWNISENLCKLGPLVANQPAPEGVRDFLCYGFVPAPLTIFKDVLVIPPGMICRLPISNDKAEWEQLEIKKQPQTTQSANTFWQKICAQTKLQNAAVLLSGGLDSAMITAAACATGTTIQAYHARFSGVDITADSDTQAARTIAQHFNISLREIKINSWDALRYFSRAVNSLSQPLGDPVILPFYLLFKALKKDQFHTVLTGEGGDQLFGSWSMKPMHIRELYLEADYSRDSGYLASFNKFHQEWQSLLSTSLLRQLSANPAVEDPITQAFFRSPSADFSDQLRWVDLHLKGIQHIQPRIEDMANNHQLCLHHPFFQTELIESALKLPTHLKMNGTQEKVLLKQLAAAHIPTDVIGRQKLGMGVPTSQWYSRGLRPLAAYWLNKKRLKKSGLLNPDYVREMVVNNKSASDGRSRRWGDRLWQLCVLECWFAGLIPHQDKL